MILNHGRLVRSGSIAELTAGTDRVVVRTPSPDQLRAALAQHRVPLEQTGPTTFQVRGLGAEQVGHLAFTAGVELHELTPQRSDLEELFFALTAAPAPWTPGMPAPTQGMPVVPR